MSSDRGSHITIGPLVKVNGELCHWQQDILLDSGFNKIAEVGIATPLGIGKITYELRIFGYYDGYRYTEKTQNLPLCESLDDAQRMAIPILSLMREQKT